jgi:hypothetical protein
MNTLLVAAFVIKPVPELATFSIEDGGSIFL